MAGPSAPNGDMAALIGSLMGNMGGGEQSEELKQQLAEASAGANDLTALVKKKIKKQDTGVTNGTSAAASDVKANGDSKKAKVEDVKD